jgi:hypothetical protein
MRVRLTDEQVRVLMAAHLGAVWFGAGDRIGHTMWILNYLDVTVTILQLEGLGVLTINSDLSFGPGKNEIEG